MKYAWLKWMWTVLLFLVVTGCAQRVAVPPPSFAAPVILPPVTALPEVTPIPSSPNATAVRPLPRSINAKVVLDPGHGGKDPGSQIYRVNEKAINLAVAKLAANKLHERGVTVILTRDSDVFIELADRAAAGRGADLFVSLHADSNPDPSKSGHSVIYPQGTQPKSAAAGRFIDQHLRANGSPAYILRPDNRGLRVLKGALCPAVLVELGYLSNRAEAARLASPAYQEKLAEGVADGIIAYLASSR